MKKLLKTLFPEAVCVVILTSCSTVAPAPVRDRAPSFDESTPASYNPNSSGFLEFITNERKETVGALITQNNVDTYNALISDYRIQYRESTGKTVNAGDGIERRGLKDGKQVYQIDSRHLAIFFKFNRWKKEGRPSDGLWVRLRDRVTP